MPKKLWFLFSFFCLIAPRTAPAATRLKELVSIQGVRENQLIGYGLVVGLNGTGDRRQTLFSAQSLTNLLQQMGVAVSPTAIRVNNTASVLVTASLPPFAQPGSRIDVTAAAIGDASNLQGGLLVLTSLKGVDGQVYAMAQGPVVTGGFIAGGGGNRQTVNHPTVGRIPGGAIIERGTPAADLDSSVKLQLKEADFTTSARIAEAVNRKFSPGGGSIAIAENSGLVSIAVPQEYASRSTEFVAEIERLTVEADRVGRVVINERTGTVVLGKDVKISPVGIMHGNLTVQISTAFDVSQPAPFSQGTTQIVPQVEVGVKEEKARNLVLQQGATVEELVRALGSIGATTRDVIAILQNLKAAGALEAEIEIL
ncbi:MAG: flagellar basal body P-ring protein FlgI [Bryobacteraceae bacterium]